MIAESLRNPRRHDWRWQLAHAVRDPAALAHWLELTPGQTRELIHTAARYPLLATPYYLSLVRDRCLSDPIVRQLAPCREELACSGSEDPLAEERDSPVPGLIHRYPDRALLLCTNMCAIHCRHCMRKRYWGEADRHIGEDDLRRAVDYVAATPQIREIILSGGDPLLLPAPRLLDLIARFRAVDHVELIRIGTRVPVVLPQRLTRNLCTALGKYGPIWIATHFNHPAELTEASARGILALLRAGIPTVNQTVLLRGVNDSVETIRELCHGLLRQRIKPYYLFHGDPVAGTMHFQTGLETGLKIMRELQGTTSGLALPHFAFDLPDGAGKVRLLPDGGMSAENLRINPD